MTLPEWPKTIKLDDVIDALEALAAQVAYTNEHISQTIAARDATITQLQHELDEHMAGAVIRQQEIDRLQGELNRQAWAQRTGRKL